MRANIFTFILPLKRSAWHIFDIILNSLILCVSTQDTVRQMFGASFKTVVFIFYGKLETVSEK